MKFGYIRETQDTCDIIQRIILNIKKFFNIIKIEKKEGKIIYYLPVFRDSKFSKYKIKKISKKLYMLLEREGIIHIALSRYLEKISELKLNLYNKNINILDGRYLFKCLIYDCIKYILDIKKNKIESR